MKESLLHCKLKVLHNLLDEVVAVLGSEVVECVVSSLKAGCSFKHRPCFFSHFFLSSSSLKRQISSSSSSSSEVLTSSHFI